MRSAWRAASRGSDTVTNSDALPGPSEDESSGLNTKDAEARQSELFEQIGRLKMELEWITKKISFSCKH